MSRRSRRRRASRTSRSDARNRPKKRRRHHDDGDIEPVCFQRRFLPRRYRRGRGADFATKSAQISQLATNATSRAASTKAAPAQSRLHGDDREGRDADHPLEAMGDSPGMTCCHIGSSSSLGSATCHRSAAGLALLAADAVVVSVEDGCSRDQLLPSHAEVAIGHVGAVEVRRRRPDTDSRVRGGALPTAHRRRRRRWPALRQAGDCLRRAEGQPERRRALPDRDYPAPPKERMVDLSPASRWVSWKRAEPPGQATIKSQPTAVGAVVARPPKALAAPADAPVRADVDELLTAYRGVLALVRDPPPSLSLPRRGRLRRSLRAGCTCGSARRGGRKTGRFVTSAAR